MHDPNETPGTDHRHERADQPLAARSFQSSQRLQDSPTLQPNREPSDRSGKGTNEGTPAAAHDAVVEKAPLAVPTMWR